MLAQTDCGLIFTGQVIDNHDDQPLVGAVIKLGEQVAVTNVDGMFAFNNICRGDYFLLISHIDCEPLEQDVALSESLNQTFYLEHHEQLIEEIEIEATAKRGELSKASTTLVGEELDNKKGKAFGDLLDGVQGISLLKTGSTITKPVINGLHSQRILLVNNDMRMEGQQWGLEHAPEIDPYSVQAVSVIQGAGSVEYGADGIGGVVLVEPVRLPDSYGLTINPQLSAFSNGRGGALSLDITGKQKVFGLPLSFQAQGSLKKAGNLKAPNYYLDNTSAEEGNFMLRAGYIGDKRGIEFKLSQYNTELGILTDSHIGNEADLLAVIENGQPLIDRGFTYDIKRPRQEILHEIGQISAYRQTGLGKLEVILSRQYNRRSEYDRFDDRPGLRLKTETYNGTASLKHSLGEKWNGKAGVQGIIQTYKANGFYLIPEYDHDGIGAFLFEKYQINNNIVAEAGLRYDRKNYTNYIPFNDFRELEDVEIDYDSIEGNIGTIENNYHDLWTGSAGVSWNVSDKASLSSYFGYGARQMLPNELYSDGVHHGTANWEVGNPNAVTERSATLQVNGAYQATDFAFDLNTYWNNIDNYSYLIPNQNLEPRFTIRGYFPIYQLTQSDVNMFGVNYSATKNILEDLKLNTTGSFLWASLVNEKEPLIFMPSNRLNHSLSYTGIEKWTGKVSLQNVFEQKRIPPENIVKDYVAPPPSYTTVDVMIGHKTRLMENDLSINLFAENLLNTEYKDYLDRFRYYAHAPGQNFGLRLNYIIK